MPLPLALATESEGTTIGIDAIATAESRGGWREDYVTCATVHYILRRDENIYSARVVERDRGAELIGRGHHLRRSRQVVVGVPLPSGSGTYWCYVEGGGHGLELSLREGFHNLCVLHGHRGHSSDEITQAGDFDSGRLFLDVAHLGLEAIDEGLRM